MTYIFESGLAHHIEGLIQQKRADGYAYNSEEKLLKRFDTFCVQNYPELTTVTYEMAAKWSEARPGEGDAYHLVEKAFDTIREKDSVSGKVIPEVIPYEE